MNLIERRASLRRIDSRKNMGLMDATVIFNNFCVKCFLLVNFVALDAVPFHELNDWQQIKKDCIVSAFT